ncbi:MAG TPA: hypothetical protein VFH02_11705 [Jiangellaceae bacterium]|jgi:hypothetical protein|nr:hypothetical protein [Jiangellaceae bacterium]
MTMAEFEAADREFLTLLRDVLEEIDPVPGPLVEAAQAGFTWRTIDAELAELTADSVLDGAAVRASDAPRLLTFTAGAVSLVVEVAATRVGDVARRLIGQIVGPRPAEVEVRHADGSLTVPTDDYGRFRAAPVPPGPISLALRFGGGRPPLVTSWVTV